MRNIGYAPFRDSYVRRIGRGAYPRFHIYVKEGENNIIINLHLDHKRPSYEGSIAHSGEYEGAIVEGEAERIKKSLN